MLTVNRPQAERIEVGIFFPFPFFADEKLRDTENARQYFELRSGFIPGNPTLSAVHKQAYQVLLEAEFYSAHLNYICHCGEKLILQFDFPNYTTADKFLENVKKVH